MINSIKKIFKIIKAIYTIIVFFFFNKFITWKTPKKEKAPEPELLPQSTEPVFKEDQIVDVPEVIEIPPEYIPEKEVIFFSQTIKAMDNEISILDESEVVIEYFLGVRVRGIPTDITTPNTHLRSKHPAFDVDRI
jgi:hypothetical protein